MSVREVMVGAKPVKVREWATVEEILGEAGVPRAEQRGLVDVSRPGEPGKTVPRQTPLHLDGGERFEQLPVGTYGAW